DKILPRCITTSGGQNYHFSGTRDFTLRELATLQGFPAYHAFEGPYIKKQIGNAFPPVVAEHLFRHVQKWLLDEDGMAPRPGVEMPDDGFVVVDEPDVVDAMVVDDDSGDDEIAPLFGDRGASGEGPRGGFVTDGFVKIGDDDEWTE